MDDEDAHPRAGAVRERGATPGERRPPGFRRSASAWAGTALAVALVAATGLWVWDVGTRETAAVPVIAAYIGPVKLPPPRAEDDRLGRNGHTDMSAYELAGQRPAQPLGHATAISYAPVAPQPMEEDIAIGQLEPLGDRATAGLPVATALSQQPLTDEGPRLSALTPAVPLPRADVVPPPDNGAADAEAIASELSTPVQSQPNPPAGVGSQHAPAAAPLAFRRPTRLAALSAQAPAEPSAETRLARDAASSPYQLQLGAYLSREETESEWRRISRRYPELLNNRALAMQTTQSGGQTYYRLRVGPFTSLIEAASLCEALKARSQDCIPAANR